MDILDISKLFKVEGEVISVAPYGNGRINDTYLVTAKFGDNLYKYILQRINDYVFSNVDGLMQNVRNVTKWMYNEILRDGGNPNVETLQLIETISDGDFVKTDDGYFRMYKYIENAITLERPRNAYDFSEIATTYAKFSKRLTFFPVRKINTVIPNYHNTVKRMNSLKLAVKNDKMDRLHGVISDVKWMSEREKFVGRVSTLLATHAIPMRVTHNDMRMNNVLLNEKTGRGMAVLDLDTVMTGSLLYDFGDAVRSGCNMTAENDPIRQNVHFNVGLYKVFTKTFVEEMADHITILEKEHLLYSVELMTFESAIRYLTDYLNGDLYYKTTFSDENLMRARTQMALIEDIEQHNDYLNDWTLKL